ncbi:MAG: UDP-3-O-(3-hydroxymyristoyl)glucosamine N-acyltransferase [Candidatus Latescibacterota bacterium]|nr:MAG: UDP-3-O-(3-hydroxymyristoyl)glucosamine N-acyltransferase [Candidatus Latescibacterota bacterium]
MASRSYTLEELAELIGGAVVGNRATRITGIAGIQDAGPGDITFLGDPKYARYLDSTRASALIRRRDVESDLPSIVVENPHLGFANAVGLLSPPGEPECEPGVHQTAIIDPSADLGQNVAIGPYCRIGPGATIGSNTKVLFGVWVGRDVTIGSDCLIFPHVVIRERCMIGERGIIHPGVVIGSDGFGFAWDGERHVKIPQVGIVVIEDDVEIGSNSAIDRAATGVTRIGRGTKIDNLVQVGHNSVIGENSVLSGQVGVSGSATIGKGVVAGGQSGFAGHIEVGDGVRVAAQSGVLRSVPAGKTVMGFPAREVGLVRRVYVCVDKLPELFKRVKKLEEMLTGEATSEGDDEAAKDDR